METLGPFKGIYRIYIYIEGLYRGNGKGNGSYYFTMGYIWGNEGICWGHIGVMEEKTEATIEGLGFRV